MSKIICDVCGTAYPEASGQCPICGCVRPADAQVISSAADNAAPVRKYEQVKGGRFSKENVRKRTMSTQAGTYAKPAKAASDAPARPQTKNKKDDSNKGLVITILVLLLAIIAVVAYIIIKFFIPIAAPVLETTDPVVTDEPADLPEETVAIPCMDISLDTYEIVLDSVDDFVYLGVTPDPFDTTEEILFESEDESIAMVESDGCITAVSEGETSVTVTCGAISVQCKVIVGKKVELVLNRQEITFEKADDTWTVYSGEIPVTDIIWMSDDESVATVIDGVVTAVGEGVTMIYGDYNGQMQSCVIRCSFIEDETQGGTAGNGNVSSDADTDATEETEPAETQPASSEYSAPFQLKNLVGGSPEDVMIGIGETFSLALVDSNGKTVKGVTWSVSGSACSVTDGKVSGVHSGYCEIEATYDGQTYTCIVRVK